MPGFHNNTKESNATGNRNRNSSGTDAETKMFESSFASLSLDSMNKGGNRPPALSVSSLSSIGEDLHYKNSSSDFSNNNNHTIFNGMPGSPLSTTSSTRSTRIAGGSALNSPIGSRGFRSDVTLSNSLGSQKYAPTENTLFSGGGIHKSLPTFQEHLTDESGYMIQRTGSFPSRQDERSHSLHDLSSTPQPRRYSSDTTENLMHSSSGIWNASNSRSNTSLSNMGCLDENEQYLGNRHRATSANDIEGEVFRYTNVGSIGSFHGEGSFSKGDESPASMHSSVHSIPFDNSLHNPRQRVKSADFVHRSRSSDWTERSSSIGHSQYMTGNYINNRPRSFSSGPATSVSPSFPYQNQAPHMKLNQGYSDMRIVDNGTLMGKNMQSYDLDNNMPHGTPYSSEHQVRAHQNSYQDRIIHYPNGAQNYQNYPRPQGMPGKIPNTVYTVKFKRSQKNFFLADHINGDIKIGSYVKVEADRGEDLGIVLSRIPIEKFNPGARLNGPNTGIPDLQLKRINRLASDQEIALLRLKEEEEAELLKICRTKTLQRGLPMNVVDAEYQFDRHKLTFFFEASCRVDFRELVRDLFSIYKTRIWMQQIDKVTATQGPLHRDSNPSFGNAYGLETATAANAVPPYYATDETAGQLKHPNTMY